MAPDAFEYLDGKVQQLREIADTTHRVVGFGTDPAGEFFFLDHIGGTIGQLVPHPQAGQVNRGFPHKLSQSGLYRSTAAHQLAEGVVRYSIQASPWEDGATGERFIAVPGRKSIRAAGKKWKFPPGTVLGKTLSLERVPGQESSRRRIETQLLVHDGVGWDSYSYAWNEQQDDAELVEAIGREQKLPPWKSPGSERIGAGKTPSPNPAHWHFGSRAECQRCHNRWSGPVLGFRPEQLNHVSTALQTAGPAGENQLALLARIGLLEQAPPSASSLVNPRDQESPLDARARSYLDVNCAPCHRMHAGGAVLSKMHADLALEKTDMVGTLPSQGNFAMPAGRVIAPGDPFRSVLYYRMAKTGSGRMPHIGSREVDRHGLALMQNWIEQLPREWEKNLAGVPAAKANRKHQEKLLQMVTRSNDPEASGTAIQQMLQSTSGALLLMSSIDKGELPEERSSSVIAQAIGHESSVIRELFERYLPPEKRVKKLGSVVDVDKLLRRPGEAERGRELFFNHSTILCRNCHQVEGRGTAVGPDLSTIGKKMNKRQLLESILEPSRVIEPRFTVYAVETVEGRVLSGIVASRNPEKIVLRLPGGQLKSIPMQQVEQIQPQRKSMMPELLLRDITAAQAADLIEFLGQLK